MTETTQPARSDDLGVVDPIRLPGWAKGSLGRVPGLARLFLVLALVDVVARAVGVIGPPLFLDPAQPLYILAGIVPRALWIALPAIVLIRRPDAEESIPWIFRGSVAISLTTLIVDSLGSYLQRATAAPEAVSFIAPVLNSLLLTAAWVMLGRGFEELRRPREASPAARTISLFVAGAFVVSAVLSLVALAVSRTQFEESLDTLILLSNALTIAVGLATGYALWAIVRGFGDDLRPGRATRFGVAAAIVWAIAALLTALLGVLFLLLAPLPTDFGTTTWSTVSVLLAWQTFVTAPLLLIAAIGIGLVDPDLADHSYRPDLLADSLRGPGPVR
jgi:hypothetical protein